MAFAGKSSEGCTHPNRNDLRNYSHLFLDDEWVSHAPLVDCNARVSFNSTRLTGRFVDLPSDAQALFWQPDLSMRNFRDDKFNVLLSRTLRVYEGGTVERIDQRRKPFVPLPNVARPSCIRR